MATVKELREQAKAAGVSGFSSMNKEDLEKALATSTSADQGGTGNAGNTTTTSGDAPAETPRDLEKASGELGSDQVQDQIDAEQEKGYRGTVPKPDEDLTLAAVTGQNG